MFSETRGAKATPAKTIPAVSKQRMELPEHLEVTPDRIETLEAVLRVHHR